MFQAPPSRRTLGNPVSDISDLLLVEDHRPVQRATAAIDIGSLQSDIEIGVDDCKRPGIGA